MSNPKGIIEEQFKRVDGYKTQISMILACVLYILETQDVWTAPSWAWPIIALMFGGSVRSMMRKLEQEKP